MTPPRTPLGFPLTAHGLIEFTSTITVLQEGFGISAVNRISANRVEVEFSDPNYEALKSTVLVSPRCTVPVFCTWDSYGTKSVQVYMFDAAGKDVPAGSFSIILVAKNPTC